MPPPPRCLSCLIALCAFSCWQLVVAAVRFPAILCCEVMVWTVAFLAFPVRLLGAIDGERKMNRVLGEMQSQMERLVWENRELEERLEAAVEEHEAMEEILDEMEEEHDDAFARIDLLESQVKALKLENMRLNEQRGKSMWDKGKSSPSEPDGTRPASRPGGTGEDQQVGGGKEGAGVAEEGEAVVRQGKAVARRRSVFSLGMSVAVGAIVWRADAPCLPLLAGLFAVVGMSMCSVARFFRSALRSRPASDAVALLSLNCFLLGVLTYPMLPSAARLALAWLPAAAPLST